MGKKEIINIDKDWYIDLVENISDLVQCVTPDGTFLYVNSAWKKALGYTDEDISKLSVFDIICPDYKEHCLSAFKDVMEGKDIGKFEVEFLTRENKRLILEGSVNCKIKDGKPLYTRAIFRDITERKKHEREIKEMQAYYELILNSASEGIFGLDKEGKHTFVNPAAANILGYSVDELIGRESHAVYHHSKKDGNPYPVGECPIYVCTLKGSNQKGRDVFWNKSGQSISVEYNCSPIFDENGKVDGSVVIFRDITKEEETQKKLDNEKNKAQQYIDIARVMILVLDKNGNISLINKRGCELLGYQEASELVGKNWFESFIPQKDREKITEFFRDMFKGGSDISEYVENKIITKTGEERIIGWHNTVLHNSKGYINATLSSGEDITERKKNEEKNREKTDELERINRLMVGREIKMMELKDEIRSLQQKLRKEN
ncbi:MAG: signal transduction histidine kinase with CheB and CheR activity [uncultured bacterium]|nr:MAG: signal transduction histidine kinase with CheB and CheR activity [uncultured bacterium]HBR71423.1 hypothetical protein [Candidatus Moranbacteria bacterium]